MQGAIDSEGTAVTENDKYMNSIEGRLQQFKTSFETLSQTIINGDIVKGVVNFGTAILDVINKLSSALGGGKGILTKGGLLFGLTNIGAISNSITKVFGKIGNLVRDLKTIRQFTSGSSMALMTGTLLDLPMATKVGASIRNLAEAFSVARYAAKEAGTGFAGFTQSLANTYGATKLAVGGILGVLTVVTTVVSVLKSVQNKMIKNNQIAVDNAKKSYSEVLDVESENSIASLYEKYSSVESQYNAGTASKEQLTEATNSLASALGLEGAALDVALEKYGTMTNAVKALSEEKMAAAKNDVQVGLAASKKNVELTGRSENSLFGLGGILPFLTWDNIFAAMGLKSHDIDMDYSVDAIKSRMSDIKDEMHDLEVQAAKTGESVTDNKKYQKLAVEYGKYKDLLKDELELEKEMSTITAQEMVSEKFDSKNINNMRQYTKARKELYEAAQKNGDIYGTEEEKNAYIDEALSNSTQVQKLISLYGELKDVRTKYESSNEKLDIIPKESLSEAIDIFKEYTAEFDRLQQTGFTEDTAHLSKLSGQLDALASSYGVTTAQLLRYIDAQNQLNNPNRLTNEARGSVYQSIFGDTDGYAQGIDDLQSRISSLSSAYQNLVSGSMKKNDVIDLLQEFPELSPYVDLTADGFGHLADGLRTLINQSPDSLIAQLSRFAETADLTDTQKAAVDGLIDSLSQMPKDALDDVTTEFGKFGDSIIKANTALQVLKEELERSDYDNNYDERVSALSGFQEEIDAGNIGGTTYAAYKKFFGLTEKTDEEVKSWINANKQYFTEGADGIAKWASKIQEMNNNGTLDKSIASFDQENGLQVDINRLDEFAAAFGWTEEMMSDFIQKYRMYVSEFDWASHNPGETLTEWSQNGLINSDGETYMSDLLDSTSMTKEEIRGVIDAINELREENGKEPIKLIDDTEGISGAIKDLENSISPGDIREMFDEYDIPIHFNVSEGVMQIQQDVIDAMEQAGASSSSILKFIEDGLNNGTIDIADNLTIGGKTLEQWNAEGKFEFEVETKTAEQSLSDLKAKAAEANDALQGDGLTKKTFNFDTTSVKDAESEVKAASNLVDSLVNKDGTLKCDASQFEQAQTILEATIRQRDALAGADTLNLRVSANDANRAVGQVATAVQTLYSQTTNRDIAIGIHADASEVSAANAQVAETLSSLMQLNQENPEITAKLGISDALSKIQDVVGTAEASPATIQAKLDSGDLDSEVAGIKTAIEAIKPTVWAEVGLSEESLSSLTQEGTISYTYTTTNELPDHENKDAEISYTYITTNSLPDHGNKTATITYKYTTVGKKPTSPAAGTAYTRGTTGSFTTGSAFKSGSWGLRSSGIGLGGEMAPEILVRDGKYTLLGEHGAEFFRYKKNDIIFNARQTEELFKYGGIKGAKPRGHMFGAGSAFIAGSTGKSFLGGVSPYLNSKINSGYSSSSSSSKSSSSSSSSSKKASDSEKSDFEEAYKYHQHLLKMEQEDEATYLAWLEQAYKDAYAQNKIELDDFYKYEEECYEKRKDVLEKSLKAQEHQIWLYAETMENKENAQVAVYQNMMKEVSEASREARARGLTEEDEYIQELQKKYRDYMDKVEELRQQPYQNAISITEKQIAYEEKGTADSTKKRIQLTRHMIDVCNDAVSAGLRRGLSETDEFIMDMKTKAREAANSIKEMILSTFSNLASSINSALSAIGNIPGGNYALSSKLYAMNTAAQTNLYNAMKNDTTGLYSTQDKFNQAITLLNTISAQRNAKQDAQKAYDSALNNMIEKRISQIKKANQEARDAQADSLSDQIDDLQDFYDKQIQMLEDEKDYEDYIKNQKEKRKSITDIQAALAQLENDDSAAAQKKKLQLRQELADKTADLDEFERDHARDTIKRQLEDERDAKVESLQAQLEAVQSYTEDEYAIRQQATADIMNMDNEQFMNYINGLIQSGEMTESEAKEMIRNFLDTASAIGIAVDQLAAYQAMLQFSGWEGASPLESTVMGDIEGYIDEMNGNTTTDAGTGQKSGQQVYNDALKAAGNAWNVAKASGDKAGMDAAHQYAEAIRATNGSITESEALGIAGQMWYNGQGYHTPMHAIAEELRGKGYVKHYAKGTFSASPGWAEYDEQGTEYFFSKNGSKYRMMSSGDKVLNARASDFLYNFATGKNSAIEELVERINSEIGKGVNGNIIAPVINMGDINIAGNADEATVSEIRRAQRDQMNYIIKEFNKMSR